MEISKEHLDEYDKLFGEFKEYIPNYDEIREIYFQETNQIAAVLTLLHNKISSNFDVLPKFGACSEVIAIEKYFNNTYDMFIDNKNFYHLNTLKSIKKEHKSVKAKPRKINKEDNIDNKCKYYKRGTCMGQKYAPLVNCCGNTQFCNLEQKNKQI